jgi:hypothetical protein
MVSPTAAIRDICSEYTYEVPMIRALDGGLTSDALASAALTILRPACSDAVKLKPVPTVPASDFA